MKAAKLPYSSYLGGSGVSIRSSLLLFWLRSNRDKGRKGEWGLLAVMLIRLPIILAFVVLSVLVSVVLSAGGRGALVVKAEGKLVGQFAGSYALLIGVSEYDDDWEDLPSVPEELRLLRLELERQGFTTYVSLNASEDDLRTSFETFLDNHGYVPDNRLLFFFAGHGHSRMGGSRGYLAPRDAPRPTQGQVESFLAKAGSYARGRWLGSQDRGKACALCF